MDAINSKEDYEAVLKRIGELWGAQTETSESNELEALANKIDEYEEK